LLRGLDRLVVGVQRLNEPPFQSIRQREIVAGLRGTEAIPLHAVHVQRAAIEIHRQRILPLQVNE
jgi:hypothetical protein